MSEKWFYSIIHSCLRLYISLQKWHSTLEHLSLHLKPRGIRFLFWVGVGVGVDLQSSGRKKKIRFHDVFFF